MDPQEIKRIVEQHLPGSRVSVKDLTGTLDHFQVEVVSEAFRGKMLLEQHRMVQAPLEPYVKDERIHALSIKTHTPEERGKVNLVQLE